MNEAKNYPSAPITEALFDIQVELPKEVTILKLEQLCSDISDQYPTKQERKRFEGKFDLKDKRGIKTEAFDLGIDGFLNWSADKKQVVQFRLDGYTFSRLKPYSSWEDHFPEFIKKWTLYREKLSPILVKRIAVRFINTIEIPSAKLSLNDYLVNAPKPPIEDSIFENFFNRIEFFIKKSEIKAVITQMLAQSKALSSHSIIFDLDVFKEINLSLDEDKLTSEFKSLRRIKNEIFEKSLKQKTKDLFE